MQQFTNILNDFKPISLKEMDCVQLMDRTDTKFIFNSNRLTALLDYALEHYRILQIGDERDFSYTSTYLDTHNFMFFNQHMTGRSMRHKVRYRTYESTGVSYLEVKCKTNKKRTIKWRIKNNLTEPRLNLPALNFLSDYIGETAFNISPVLVNKFNRLTLVGIETKERITIDHNLCFSFNGCNKIELPYLGIAELKREGLTNKSPFLDILRKMEIRKSSFSKYCIGNALLRPMSKTNILKPSFLNLKKIENDKSIHDIA